MTSAVTDAARTAHAAAATLIQKSLVKPGDKLPTTETVKEDSPTDVFALGLTGKNLIVGVPGAFVPLCTGMIVWYDRLREKGIDEVFVVCVNDAFVVSAWRDSLAPDGTPVRFIADDQGAFVSSLGLLEDTTAVLGTPRARRFALVVKDGVVENVILEENSNQVVNTHASKVITLL
ncbi:Redoxin [Artomyces pyxidatus]|uniref:Redoxin n=1 Tax=Artomyces pyxidatus TaxID=48021 RepID=A0ACB8TGI4_9AGAM|nr:Redoxin [Artomyces pyxidatus]